MSAIKTLKEYLEQGKPFVIPDYQRGYVWGKQRDGESDSVSYFIDNLVEKYNNGKDNLFLQGFTVTEDNDEIILIDGQQRTTCIFLLMKYLGYSGYFNLRYEIREASNNFLKQIDFSQVDENPSEEYQDIFFLKKTMRIIQDKLKYIDKDSFLDYTLNGIKFLYIIVSPDQATTVFTMMNGNKAKMFPEEVIKAEILRLASLNDFDYQTGEQSTDGNTIRSMYAKEWESSMLRSRYAREWDRWLHWWNMRDVQSLFGCKNTMGLLISSYLNMKKGVALTYESFKKLCLNCETAQEAKNVFDGLRRLQKRFEDAYNEKSTHNMIGAILRIFDNDNQKKFIQYYFVNDNRTKLETYYKLVFLGMTHDEIVKKDEKAFAKKYDDTYNALNDNYLYLGDNKEKEVAFRFLLRLNVDQDTIQNRYFNFEIWESGQRSLEHIMAKSKVGHLNKQDGKWYGGDDVARNIDFFEIKRDSIKTTDEKNKIIQTSEHSIGNLVLLYKNENSVFNNRNFLEKKELFFNPNKEDLFKSRHLLHTICVFAEKEKWDGPCIAKNKISTIDKFEKDYSNIKKEYNYGKQE